MKTIVSIFLFTLSTISFSQSTNYKEMMTDLSINFYDVCAAADLYFETHPKGKGSGWKGYQRWKHDNEFKYYPSGDRSNVDPYFVKNQFEQFQQNATGPKSLFTAGWEELGPTSPGQITGHYSFGMGRIHTFYVDPSNPLRLYLGTACGGFWKSLDGGATWSGGSTDFLAASGVNTIAVSPTNPDSVLINVRNSQNGTTHGIYRSVDGGNTWSLSNFNPTTIGWGGLGTNRLIYKIKYHPTIPDLVFIGTRDGLYRSDDDLANWTVPVGSHDFTDIDFHPTNPNIVYAYARNTPNVIYVSTNTGTSFTTVSIPGSSGGVGTVAVSPDCPNCVYYMSNNGLWKSTNNGTSFTLVSNPGESDAGFAVSDTDDTKMICGYVDAFASSNGGVNFSQVTYWSLGNTNGAGNGHQTSFNTSTDYIHADLQMAECVNGIFYAVTDGFMVSSADNGTTWNILSKDIAIRMNYNLGVSQSNHDRTICGSQDNGTSINTENGWVEMYGADGMEGFIHPLNDDWMIGSLQNGGRRRTFNAGQSNGGITPSGQTAYWIAPIFYDPIDQMTVYSLGENIHKSEDFGSTWTNIGSPTFSSTVQFAAIAENNSDLMVATRYEHIELSTDGGATWADIQGSLPNYNITDVAFDPNNDSTIVVTYARHQNDNSKVFITHDLGGTWQNITYNLGNMPARSVVIDHTNASTIYLGTEIGVYKKAMSDVTWSLYNSDLPNTSIREMEVMWGSNTLRATTWGRGLWEYALDGRVNFPAITNTDISNPPTETEPKATTDQFVTATIDYNNTLSSVYVEWSINAPTFGNVITMNNVSGNDWISSVPLPDQPVGTKMYFKVFAVGSAGDTTETYKFMYTVKPFEFCTANGTNDGSNLRITNVSIANVNNSSNNDSYTYYGNETVFLAPGSTYSITVTSSTGWPQNDYAAWIDFNKNAIFDSNEAILYQIDAGSSTATANFTVPVNATLEDTLRMRVRLGYWFNTEIDPCGPELGEVEDYPVWIQCLPSSGVDQIATCNSSYTWIDGNTYTSSNSTATFTVSNATGCDSIVTLNLTMNNATTSTDVISSCTPITWIDGNTYSSSNSSATFILPNSSGCDSIVALDLTINNSTIGTDVISSCSPITWIDGNTYSSSNSSATHVVPNSTGCDSIITLNLTINSATTGTDLISACDSYTWIDGNTYTASNSTATHVLTNSSGCDSIVTLNLSINVANANTTVSGQTITADAAGLTYQWIDCSNNSPIIGETSQSFTAVANGSYAVVVTDNSNCSDTSSCTEINTIGIDESFFGSDISIYPNPTSGQYTIELGHYYPKVDLEVTNSLGQLIVKERYYEVDQVETSLDAESGVYFIKLILNEKELIVPLVKQ